MATTKATTPNAQVSARQKLELSQLTPGAIQRETMGTDLDVEKLSLYLASTIIGEVSGAITAATISRSIEGSSQLVVTVNDYDRSLLTSGLINKELDVQIDGLWFRISGADKSGDELTLTFEDREISLLRDHEKWKVMNRNRVTRAQFVLNLIREVKDFTIPVQIPELNVIQPVERYTGDLKGAAAILNKDKGIPTDTNKQIKKAGQNSPIVRSGSPVLTGGNAALINKLFAERMLTVGGGSEGKEVAASKEQITNANIILNTGEYMGVKRKLLVCAIMTAIVESELVNLTGGDGSSVGLFQQIDSWGTFEERHDPETASKLFYNAAIAADAKAGGRISYNDLCQIVQVSAHGDKYGQHRTQAEKYVTAFGTPGGDTAISSSDANGSNANGTAGGAFYFYRGDIEHRKNKPYRKPENSWTCIQRLADEVNWRAFFVSGVFWFISEDDLFKQMPLMYVFEGQDGIIGIDGDYHRLRKSGTLTVTAHAGRWLVPPGSLVWVENMGPWNGRWLVSQFDRDLFTTEATITLTKPRPALPEPITPNNTDVSKWLAKPSFPVTGPNVGINGGQRQSVDPGNADSQTQAQELLLYGKAGRWKDDNGAGYQQIYDTANGIAVTNIDGNPVGLYYKTIALVNWLIKQGFVIGTFAWCHDHHNDGLNGHYGGLAVDIDMVNDHFIGSGTIGDATYDLTLKVATLIWNIEGPMRPRQLITSGVGSYSAPRALALTQLCLPNASTFDYLDSTGRNVLDEHKTHIHVGY